jgi:Bacterial Ig domain
MGERYGRTSRRRALSAVLVTAIVCATPFVGSTAAHAILPGGLLAVEDSYTMTFTTAGTALNIAAPGLLANDSGPSTTTVDVSDSDITSWNDANVFVHANGSFTYKPDPTAPFTGVDSFTYWIQESAGGNQDLATVTIRVNPVVRNDAYFAHKNTTLNVAAPGIFANDLGVDAYNALYDSDITSAHGGSVTVNDDGSFSYDPPNASFEGTDTFGYVASDTNGDNTFPATVTVHVDSTAPTIVVTAPASSVNLSTSVHVVWRGSDPSGIARYDVQKRHAVWNGGLTTWTTWKASTTLTSAILAGNLGVTYCFRARATDRAGNVSGWSPQRCSAIPMGANRLTYAGSWTKTARSDVFGGLLSSTKTKGAVASRANLRAKRIYLIATKCATCGTVQVRWNNVAIANVNLAYGGTVHKQALWVASFSGIKVGTLKIVVTSATGKTVALEGLAAYSE